MKRLNNIIDSYACRWIKSRKLETDWNSLHCEGYRVLYRWRFSGDVLRDWRRNEEHHCEGGKRYVEEKIYSKRSDKLYSGHSYETLKCL